MILATFRGNSMQKQSLHLQPNIDSKKKTMKVFWKKAQLQNVVCTRKPDIIYQTRCIEELFSNKLTEAWENIVKIYWVKQEDDWMSTPKSIWLNNVQCRLFNQEGQIRGRVRVISNHWLVLAINDNEDRVWPKPQANY